MLIESQDTIEAFNKGKEFLLTLPGSLDPEILKESPIIFVFSDLSGDSSIPYFDGSKLSANFDYPESIQNQSVIEEFRHYEKLLVPKIQEIVGYLKENPFSKRAIINIWDDAQRALNNKAECLVYLNFRKSNNGLDMNVHMRANDAENKILLNFHIFAAVHRFVSRELGERVGVYTHFVDSYHIYRG